MLAVTSIIKLAIGAVLSNVQRALIMVALVIVSSGTSALFAYVKGFNTAAAKCQVNKFIRERDEYKRDRDAAVSASLVLQSKLKEMNERDVEREKKDADNAAKFTPIPNCVVPDVPQPAKRLRNVRPR